LSLNSIINPQEPYKPFVNVLHDSFGDEGFGVERGYRKGRVGVGCFDYRVVKMCLRDRGEEGFGKVWLSVPSGFGWEFVFPEGIPPVKRAKLRHHYETCVLIYKVLRGFDFNSLFFKGCRYHKVNGHYVVDVELGGLWGSSLLRVVYLGTLREPLYWSDIEWVLSVVPSEPNSFLLVVASSFAHHPAYMRLRRELRKYEKDCFVWFTCLNASIDYEGISERLKKEWAIKRKRSWSNYNVCWQGYAEEHGIRRRRIYKPVILGCSRFVEVLKAKLAPFQIRFLKRLQKGVEWAKKWIKHLLRLRHKFAPKLHDIYRSAWDLLFKVKDERVKKIDQLINLLRSGNMKLFLQRYNEWVGLDPPKG